MKRWRRRWYSLTDEIRAFWNRESEFAGDLFWCMVIASSLVGILIVYAMMPR